jgi:hypothetical protein
LTKRSLRQYKNVAFYCVLVGTSGIHTALRRNLNLKISEREEVEWWKGSWEVEGAS